MTKPRLDGFIGSECDYVQYLEQTVSSLRRQLSDQGPHSDVDASATTREIPRLLSHPEPGAVDCRDDFQIIQYVPHSPGRKKRRCDNPAWLQNARTLVQETPKAEHWAQTLKEKGLYDIMASGKALTYLLDTNVQPDMSAMTGRTLQKETKDVLSCVRHYAQATATRTMTASIALTLANFQRFLVLSACAVLLEENVRAVEVFNVAKICIGDDVTDDYCGRVVRSAKYVNELIDSLNLRGWGYRSSELLLLWNRTPAFYFMLACSVNNSLEYLINALCQKELTGHEVERRSWTPIFIPSLVHHILGNKISVAKISHTLRYKNAHLLKVRKNVWRLGERSSLATNASRSSAY